jgi:hypothetical protein
MRSLRSHKLLFKELSRRLGARKARKIIRELEADGHTVNDTGDLLSAFTWKSTRQGHDYWSNMYWITTDYSLSIAG